MWNSLIAGEGTRQEAKGIGKFGLGLPQSSMSQCKHVTVYSWLTPNDVLFVEINANDDSKNGLGATEPQKTKLPELWKNKSKYLKNSKSGTMVIWKHMLFIKYFICIQIKSYNIDFKIIVIDKFSIYPTYNFL